MNKPLKILLLEDNVYDADLLQRELRRSKLAHVLETVSSRLRFTEALNAFKPDLILSDHVLPGFDSFEALRMAKGLYPAIPFIMVTGSVTEDFAVHCLREGADDFILKGSLLRLPQAIRTMFC